MSQEEALSRIIRGEEVYEQYQPYFTKDNRKYVELSLTVYRKAHKQGMFGPEYAQTLKTMDWCGINLRYGVNSITGFVSEILAVGMWNSKHISGPQYQLNKSRDGEIKGYDVYVTNPRWSRDYGAQVKTAGDLNCFTLYPDWCRYINLDRFVVADKHENRVLYVEYTPFINTFDAGTTIRLNDIMQMDYSNIKPMLLEQ